MSQLNSNSQYLREAVQHIHDAAEHTALSQMLIQGDFSAAEFVVYLSNMQIIYSKLESCGIITHEPLKRSRLILADIKNNQQLLSDDHALIPILSTVHDYADYIGKLSTDQLWAHVYVHYLGDLYGGQIIAKALPYSCAYLEFHDRPSCISHVRSNIDNCDPQQAIVAFEWVIKIYEELYRILRPSGENI